MKALAKRRSLEGLIAYGEYVFGYKAADHHRELVGEILSAVGKAGTENAENIVILEPRGHAKTTWGDTISLSWLISQFPYLRIGLMSKTSKHANDFSRAIRYTFESNPRHQEIFGYNVSEAKWTDSAWLHKDSPHHGSNNVTVFSQGAGGQIASKRFDVILCDDILDEENTSTPEQREAVETWFWKTLSPCLAPNGVIIVLGTRWTDEDLYQKLSDPIEKGGKGWRLVLRKAINEDPETGERVALWPDYWTLQKLDKERVQMGTALFSCAYQNDVSGLMEGNIFLSRNFQYYSKLDPEKSFTVRMGIDLASSEKQTADYTARAIVAEDGDGNFYVMSIYQDRRETGHAAFVNDGFTAFQDMSLVICESQQFQSTLIQEVMRDYPRIPIEGKKADTDKVTRARAVAAKYEAHKVWHHASLKDSLFETQLKTFPRGHDDMVDALGYGMDLGGTEFSFAAASR